jgi:hypothetical protein
MVRIQSIIVALSVSRSSRTTPPGVGLAVTVALAVPVGSAVAVTVATSTPVGDGVTVCVAAGGAVALGLGGGVAVVAIVAVAVLGTVAVAGAVGLELGVGRRVPPPSPPQAATKTAHPINDRLARIRIGGLPSFAPRVHAGRDGRRRHHA